VRRLGPGASERAAARGKQPLERRWRGRRVHLHAPPHAHSAAPAPARCIPPPPLDRGRRGAAVPFHRRLHQHVRTYKPPTANSLQQRQQEPIKIKIKICLSSKLNPVLRWGLN